MFIDIFEAPEVEIARLAASPEGSKSHALASLPVNIQGWLEDRMIELPHEAGWDEHTVVVVPFKYHRGSDEKREMPFKRHTGSWDCIVIASDHPSYPVGGHRLCVSESELVRGTLRTLELGTSAAAALATA
jgi:hypothetical protein